MPTLLTPSPLAVVFAAVEPTWTDKEVLVAVGSTAAVVVSVMLAVWQLLAPWRHKRDRDLADLRKENARLKNDLNQANQGLADAHQQVGVAATQNTSLRRQIDDLGTKLADKDADVEQLQAEVRQIQQEADQHQREAGQHARRIERALGKDGQTWNERVPAGAPEFKPLGQAGRRTPIISLLNLKGGVGKTTMTANLAAAFDAKGYRVLVVDLDLQGSLTGLFLSEADQVDIDSRGYLLGDFLNAAFCGDFPNLLDFVVSILPGGRSGLVPTSDNLAYAETNLLTRWLLRDGSRDVRFLLRRELHLKRITGAYDVVLLDCPPVLNVSCVNALAASDYVLVPVMPSAQATARVPVLLKRVRAFRENVNPDLKVLGVVTNRSTKSELTSDEKSRLFLLGRQCLDSWGAEVPLLETFIRQSVEIRQAEDQRRPVGASDQMREAFLALADEIEGRLPRYCRPDLAGQPREVPS